MNEYVERIAALPPHALGGLAILLLYALQAEVRFGSRARQYQTQATDRHSSLYVSLAAAVPTLGFVVAVKGDAWSLSAFVPAWFYLASLPGLPGVAWSGVAAGAVGLALRLWAVLTLRERYTRTLLVHHAHLIERGGPYRYVRHPGYLGSLLTLNGVALSSGNGFTLALSLLATIAAYAYRVGVEDAMLVEKLGPEYAIYRSQIPALVPSLRASAHTDRPHGGT